MMRPRLVGAALALVALSCAPTGPTPPPSTTLPTTTTTLPGGPTPTPSPTPPASWGPAPPGSYDCDAAAQLAGYIAIEGSIRGEYIFGSNPLAIRSLAAEGSSVEVFAAERGAVGIRSIGGNRFAATIAPEDARRLAEAPQVDYVQEVQPVTVGPFVAEGGATAAAVEWNLARVTNRERSGSTFRPARDGLGGVCVVVDTGINPSDEFGARLVEGYSTVGGGTADPHGHGTHVAGTCVGRRYGIARAAEVLPIRVLGEDGSGSTATVAQGVEIAFEYCSRPGIRCAVNMSLGTNRPDPTIDASVCKLRTVAAVSVAAGNEGGDARNSSPARVWQVDTVKASDSSDALPSWTNRGPAAPFAAPGVGILSVGGRMSGSSMASPHWAGTLLVLWSLRPYYTGEQVQLWAHSLATEIGSVGRLAYCGPEAVN